MSDLILTVLAGPADRNSGRPRSSDVLASLYVGGSGLWEIVAVGTDRRLRLRAGEDDALAVLTGVAVLAELPGAVETADRVLGPWRTGDVEVPDAVLAEVAAHARGINIAAVVTALAASDDYRLVDGLHEAGWSVLSAVADTSRTRSQW